MNTQCFELLAVESTFDFDIEVQRNQAANEYSPQGSNSQ